MLIRIGLLDKSPGRRQGVERSGFAAPLADYLEASYMDRNKDVRILCGSIQLLFGKGGNDETEPCLDDYGRAGRLHN